MYIKQITAVYNWIIHWTLVYFFICTDGKRTAQPQSIWIKLTSNRSNKIWNDWTNSETGNYIVKLITLEEFLKSFLQSVLICKDYFSDLEIFIALYEKTVTFFIILFDLSTAFWNTRIIFFRHFLRKIIKPILLCTRSMNIYDTVVVISNNCPIISLNTW